jgi:hypothetical protein
MDFERLRVQPQHAEQLRVTPLHSLNNCRVVDSPLHFGGCPSNTHLARQVYGKMSDCIKLLNKYLEV